MRKKQKPCVKIPQRVFQGFTYGDLLDVTIRSLSPLRLWELITWQCDNGHKGFTRVIARIGRVQGVNRVIIRIEPMTKTSRHSRQYTNKG